MTNENENVSLEVIHQHEQRYLTGLHRAEIALSEATESWEVIAIHDHARAAELAARNLGLSRVEKLANTIRFKAKAKWGKLNPPINTTEAGALGGKAYGISSTGDEQAAPETEPLDSKPLHDREKRENRILSEMEESGELAKIMAASDEPVSMKGLMDIAKEAERNAARGPH